MADYDGMLLGAAVIGGNGGVMVDGGGGVMVDGGGEMIGGGNSMGGDGWHGNGHGCEGSDPLQCPVCGGHYQRSTCFRYCVRSSSWQEENQKRI